MKLIYQAKEIELEVGVNIALERLMNMIKLSINIPLDMDILLFDVMRNIIVVPGLTSHLWCNSEKKLPIYRIITQKNNGNDDNKTGWCKYLLNNYMYPFLNKAAATGLKKMN
ncbi:unnamed protein product [Rotaria socialis]|uniref:Uncharacterized protein n=1 Tax=Rotaria socialis TaxID=392032 RepID=A0A817N8K6_9BILA|nr:unnamed protein product [Rotaria socialis]